MWHLKISLVVWGDLSVDRVEAIADCAREMLEERQNMHLWGGDELLEACAGLPGMHVLPDDPPGIA